MQGGWHDLLKITTFTFTADNVIYHIGESPGHPEDTTMDFREMFANVGMYDSVSGDRWPTYKLYNGKGTLIVTFTLWPSEELLGLGDMLVMEMGEQSVNYFPDE
jgi:hypothetical protein